MADDKPEQNDNIRSYVFELLVGFFQTAAQSFVRYFVVVGFFLLSFGGHLNKGYLIWGVYLLALFGLWKLFDQLDMKIEGIWNRLSKRK